MFKRILSLLLVAAIATTMLVSCGGEQNDTTPSVTTPADTTPADTTPADSTPAGSNDKVIEPDAEAGTLGHTLWTLFQSTLATNPTIAMDELATALVVNEHIAFMGGAMPVEAGGFFTGFNNYQISGFKSGAVFMPMMGSIAFVGYVFQLEEGADVKAFIKSLTDNCDPRWNICVTADQTVCGAVGNTVFFVMCPTSMDNGDQGGDAGVEMGEVIWPDVETGVGATMFEAFLGYMEEDPTKSAEDLAFLLAMHESIPFMSGSMAVEPGYLAGFNNFEVTGFTSAAVFMPMIGSYPFVGYIFQLEEGADVQNFISDLQANADLRWNICVAADQLVIGAVGNTVFFLMCPETFEDTSEGGMGGMEL